MPTSGRLRFWLDFYDRHGIAPWPTAGGEGSGGGGSGQQGSGGEGGQGAGAGAGGTGGQGSGAGQQGQQGGESDEATRLREERDAEKSANKALKDFAAARGIKVADLLKQIEDGENATKTELQKAQDKATAAERRTAEIEQERRADRAENALIKALTEKGCKRITLAVDAVKGKVDYDDQGQPKNAAALVEQLTKDAPELFGSVSGNGGGGNRDQGGGGAEVTPGIGRLRNAYQTSSKTASRR